MSETILTSSVEEPEQHLGIIRVSPELMEIWGIPIRECDIQGMLEDAGVFTQLHQKMLLPASYTICGIFFEHLRAVWNLYVKSPDLPIVQIGTILPSVMPYYTDNGEGPHLDRIEIEGVPVGTSWCPLL